MTIIAAIKDCDRLLYSAQFGFRLWCTNGGKRVISKGSYAIVRHPGYAGFLLVAVANPLALNSLISIIPALIYLAITVRVTAIEAQMLHDELAGGSPRHLVAAR